MDIETAAKLLEKSEKLYVILNDARAKLAEPLLRNELENRVRTDIEIKLAERDYDAAWEKYLEAIEELATLA